MSDVLHRCDPPCQVMLMEEHRQKRKRMTKAQLLADAELSDEAWVNQSEELDMANAYIADLRATQAIDVERLHYALEAVDPVAFGRDGTPALSREDVDHFLYAKAVADAYETPS